MILESLIQLISTALAFTLLATLIAACVFYARYKLGNRKPTAPAGATAGSAAVVVPLVTETQTAVVRVPVSTREASVAAPAISRKRLHFAGAKEA